MRYMKLWTHKNAQTDLIRIPEQAILPTQLFWHWVKTALRLASKLPHHCWFVLPEVIVYAYTQGAFHHLDPCNANPSGSQLDCRFFVAMAPPFILGLVKTDASQWLPSEEGCISQSGPVIANPKCPFIARTAHVNALHSSLVETVWPSSRWLLDNGVLYLKKRMELLPDHCIWN